MPVLPDYVPLVDGQANAADGVNSQLSPVFTLLGTTDSTATLDTDNLSPTANIKPSQIQDTGMTLGGASAQTLVQTTNISGKVYNYQKGGVSQAGYDSIQLKTITGTAQSMALTAGSAVYDLTAGGGADATLSKITGGAEGDIVVLILDAGDGTHKVTALNLGGSTIGAAADDMLMLKLGADVVGPTNGAAGNTHKIIRLERHLYSNVNKNLWIET